MAGLRDIADQRTQKLSGGQSQRVRFAVAMVSDPDLAGARRADRGHGRGGAQRLLGDHAHVRVPGQDGDLRDALSRGEADAYADRIILMARGRVVADGATTEIKSRVGGKTIRVTLPGVSTADLGAPLGRRRRRHSAAAPSSCTATTPTGASAPCSPRTRRPRDIEITGAGLEQAFLALTGDDEDELTVARARSPGMNPTYFKYELVRLIRNKRFVLLLPRLPAAALPAHRRVEQERHRRSRRLQVNFLVSTALAMAGYGAHDGVDGRRGANRGRAQRGLRTGSCGSPR